ncbi:MAG: hypothetical protein ABSA91_13325, partial [Acidimicrobiales bacterium]
NGFDPGAVTEVDVSTGALVKDFYGAQYEFDYPDGLALSGDGLFVTSGVSVTELDTSTGALVRVISDPPTTTLPPKPTTTWVADLVRPNVVARSPTGLRALRLGRMRRRICDPEVQAKLLADEPSNGEGALRHQGRSSDEKIWNLARAKSVP